MANQYGSVERNIAKFLSKFPAVKSGIKSAYARLMYIRNKTDSKAISTYRIATIGKENLNTFFGYYDRKPLSENGFLICHSTTHPTDRKPDGNGLDILIFSLEELATPVFGVKTKVYNWQQGARAHWLDSDLFIFNDFDSAKQRYISRVFSLKKRKEVNRYDLPVQDSFRRDYFLAIDYRRIQALRPDYGYRNLPGLNDNEMADIGKDGVWKVDQRSGHSTLLYSIADVCAVESDPCFATAKHKINHVMISPDGQKFIFLHRYFVGKRKFDRLFLAQANEKKLKILSNHEMVSHCFWVNDNALISYMRGPTGRDGYYIINTDTGQITPYSNGKLDSMGDGHPHVHGNWFITDTYPDKSRMQHLLKASLVDGEVEVLGQFFQDLRFGGETRCDLHPRVSPDGTKVFFDSVFNGKRKLCMLDLQP
ncbi:glycosyl transferase [Candidimonas sp. SYP-B2681]|uniref:glycosyl transferase n=1 Tax=Candidimonas sp. SYP-B2681 TaxID=2497686 RepID=UPI000F89391D|nr:glycosyl transferase [Candidimonas sp. SYP-B2681]RTZ42383.1 glycosyl transferase [Candidimonas sp. SYP-B2681]